VTDGGLYPEASAAHVDAGETRVLVKGPHFTLIHAGRGRTDALANRQRWVIPLSGAVRSGDDETGAGGCLLVEPREDVTSEGTFLLAASGPWS
jgi:hypothetical protein